MDLAWVPRSMAEGLEPVLLRSVGGLGLAWYAQRVTGSRTQGQEGKGSAASGPTLGPCWRKR